MAVNLPKVYPFDSGKLDISPKNVAKSSPFSARSKEGATENIEKVTPFIGTKNYYTSSDDGRTQYPSGTPDGEDGRAYYEYQKAVQIVSGGTITLDGPLQIIPISGTGFESPISSTPLGVNAQLGWTVTLYGISDELPPKMVNSRGINYGVWLNGAVTFYKGYSIQLQLVELGEFKLWLQISKNF